MGIRYYGWAVSAEESARALHDPWSVITAADQRLGSSDWADIDLDKAWCLLQGLFRSDGLAEPRAGYALVAGDVTYPHGFAAGYEPHVGVLTPEQAHAVALDVASVTAIDLRSYCAGLRFADERRRQIDQDYLEQHLRSAQAFTDEVASRGHGIVYTIG